MDFFTLHALAAEWDDRLAGARLTDAWTQSANELSLALEMPDGAAHTVRVLCDPALPLLFRADGVGRQRHNTADVLEALLGDTTAGGETTRDGDRRAVTGVRTAHLDRFVFFDFADGSALQIRLFGPRPNVFWVSEGIIRAAFLRGEEREGEDAPEPRAAPHVTDGAQFQERWRENRRTVAQAASSAVPLVSKPLAADAARRAGLDPERAPGSLSDAEQSALWTDGMASVLTQMETPTAHVVWRGEVAEALLPAALHHLPDARTQEAFETFDRGVSAYAKRALAQRHFQALYQPVEGALERAAEKRARSADAMLEELQRPSRAERYERDAHLLMARATGEGPGRDEITLPDIISGSEDPIVIKLDPALSAVENAERLYDKARRTRRAREDAESRWETVQEEADLAASLLDGLRAIDRLGPLRDFLKTHEDDIDRFRSGGEPDEEPEPFRRIPLPGDVEAWVGKNARANAELITRHAGPHDIWMHARGVPGSHLIIRRPARTWEPPKETLHAAARVAAHFSKARTQSLAPVSVTERKYVRPIKGGAPGLVRLDREDVLMVEPGLPNR